MTLKCKITATLNYLFLAVCISGCAIKRDGRPGESHDDIGNSLRDSTMLLISDLSYGTGSEKKIDVYFPTIRSDSTGLIFYIHGGAWFGGDKNEAKNWYKFFQDAGYAVACINYRLVRTPDNYSYPCQIFDIDSAISFVLAHSKEWGISKTRTVIMGPSAGANLALLYAYRYNTQKKIKTVVSFSAAMDLMDPEMLSKDIEENGGLTSISMDKVVASYLGEKSGTDSLKRTAASPIHYISDSSVPTILVHGMADELVPFRQSEQAYQLLKSHGIPCEIELVQNGPHNLLKVNIENQLQKVVAFLNTNLPE
jgi:acetyl esterase/lipase